MTTVLAWEDGCAVEKPDDFIAPSPIVVSIEAIKAECRRRILLVMTEDQQRNTLAAGQAAMMEYGSDPSAWPVDLQNRQNAAMIAWVEIERLRARSNEIETMNPIPDVLDDELWNPQK